MMSSNPALAVGGGMVPVADREFFVRVLPLRGEHSLTLEMRRRAKSQYGPGGYFAKCAAFLDWLKEQKRFGEFQTAVQRITEMEANNDLPAGDPVELFRQTSDGVAVELFYRTRDTHPEVSLKELQSIITEANAVEVHLAIIGAITDEGKAQTR